MKSFTKKTILFGLIISSLTIQVNAQIQYTGCSATGTNASAIGKNSTASGNNSFAGGYNTQASGSNTFAFGYKSKATQSTNAALGNTAIASGVGSIAIGNYVKATAQNTFVFGSGTTSSYPLTNNIESSIAFGVNSNKPTMLITKSLNNNYTGKVAIGQITSPQAKLHIRSDNNEDASVFLEPTDKSANNACIKLYDENHTITVEHSNAMHLNSGSGPLKKPGFILTTHLLSIGMSSGATELKFGTRKGPPMPSTSTTELWCSAQLLTKTPQDPRSPIGTMY